MPHPLIGFGLDRKAVLSHHLSYNHFPAVDLRWIPLCEQAIDLAVSHAEWGDDGMVIYDSDALNDQIGQGKTARQILDGLHLWDFVEADVLDAHNEAADAGEYEPKRGE